MGALFEWKLNYKKMQSLAIVTVFVALALSSATPVEDNFEAEWAQFKVTHGKKYSGEAEEYLRKLIYQGNKEKVAVHNAEAKAGKHSFTMEMNQFGDMLTSEFSKMMNRYSAPTSTGARATFVPKADASLPDNVDWRSKGLVSPIKNQGQCGSCWSFSTTGSLEGQYAKKTGNMVPLSEQQLMDCSTSFGNQACNGGLMDSAFKYIESVAGVESEEDYPYTAADGTCHFEKSKAVTGISGYTDVKSGSEDDLQQAVATVGPISVAIDASHISFQLYEGGVYYAFLCSASELDHGVLVVGYGSEDDKDYWIVKNSWGKTWGEAGYIRMSRNRDNNCGIATQASYPTI